MGGPLRLSAPAGDRQLWAHPLGMVEQGCLLVANGSTPSSLGDDRMLETVVLVAEHGPKGSLGLILNRPTPLMVGGTSGLEIPVPDGAKAFAKARLFCGGYRRDERQPPEGI